MWVFGFSHGVCPTELRNLVSSLEYLVSNRRRVLLGGIRLGGSATLAAAGMNKASSSGTSLNTKRLNDDTENLTREQS